MQTFLKLASNPKIFVNDSQFSCCVYYSLQLVNTGRTGRTITIVLPSVGCIEHYLLGWIAWTGLQCLWCCGRELVKPAMTLLSSGNTSTLTNENVFFPPLIAILGITPRETSSRAQLGGGEWCKSQMGRRNGRQRRYCLSSNHFQLMRQIKGNVMNNCGFFQSAYFRGLTLRRLMSYIYIYIWNTHS